MLKSLSTRPSRPHANFWLSLVALSALAGCAATVHFDGEPMQAAGAGAAIELLPSPGGEAVARSAEAAVRDELARSGLTISDDASQVAEVGFAMADKGLRAARPEQAATGGVHLFCRARYYTLSIVVTDRRTGARTGSAHASTTRCRGKLPEILPLLARAAVQRLRS